MFPVYAVFRFTKGLKNLFLYFFQCFPDERSECFTLEHTLLQQGQTEQVFGHFTSGGTFSFNQFVDSLS